MARIRRNPRPGWLERICAAVLMRRQGFVSETLGLWGRHGPVLAASIAYMGLFDRANRLPARVRRLVKLRTAMRVGCPS